MKSVAIIGSGFSALSAACHLAKTGNQVSVFEKNDSLGGRARRMEREGFTFDMGPSWYWMPDVFDRFFDTFGKKTSDYYQLDRLDPGYRVVFDDDVITIGDSMDKIEAEFERVEPGSSRKLKSFIQRAGKHYSIAMDDVVLKPGLSPLELVTPDTVLRADQFLKNISQVVRKGFRDPKLVATLEFPVLFLGAKPERTPAFYSFMNYADFGLGTWHPQGGMYEVVKAMVALGKELGVTFETGRNVMEIRLDAKGTACGLRFADGTEHDSDVVLSGADYHHTETLLPPAKRQFTERYWERKTFAPSSLLFYVGFEEKLDGVAHHNLHFDTDFDRHAHTIYDVPDWPEEPLFYANFPSVTDPGMAPEGKEAGFFLIPIAPGLKDGPEQRERYFELLMDRLSRTLGKDLHPLVRFSESFCVDDFVSEYNSYKGNAYGMANTLDQTAFLRPGLKSRKVRDLYFTGQLTVPGPGVPPALISGELVAEMIQKNS